MGKSSLFLRDKEKGLFYSRHDFEANNLLRRCRRFFSMPGVNFTNFLREAFTHADPKGKKS